MANAPFKKISEFTCLKPELFSAEEKEEDELLGETDFYPEWFEEYITYLPAADAHCMTEFEARKPALGLDDDKLQSLLDFHDNVMTTPGHKRIMFKHLRDDMLLSLIPCSGCKSVPDLIAVLKQEKERNKPSPIPEWYIPPRPGKINSRLIVGYRHCDRRGCYVTEDVDRRLKRCGKCYVAFYCSSECSTAHWYERHKSLCKKARKHRESEDYLNSIMAAGRN